MSAGRAGHSAAAVLAPGRDRAQVPANGQPGEQAEDQKHHQHEHPHSIRSRCCGATDSSIGTVGLTSQPARLPSRWSTGRGHGRPWGWEGWGGMGFVNTNVGSEAMCQWRSRGLRCCLRDGGLWALQSRLTEEGSKPPRGALANDCRAERRGKRRGNDRVRCGPGR